MKRRTRSGLSARSTVAVLALLAAGCAGTPEPQGDASAVRPPVRDYPTPPDAGEPLAEIAYVGPDGNIHTVDRDGRNHRRVTARPAASGRASLRYGGPVWSPDGSFLAFMSFEHGEDGVSSALHAVGADGEGRRTLVARTAVSPLYLGWSPQARVLAFVGARPGSSQLELRRVGAPGEQPGGQSERQTEPARTLVKGRPLHWTFCADDTKILAHVDGTRRYGGRVAVFDVGGAEKDDSRGGGGSSSSGDTRSPPRVIENDPTPFRAPACSPDGREAAVAVRSVATGSSGSSSPQSSPGGRIMAVDLESGAKRRLAAFEGRAAFSYSPDGRHIAYTDGVTTRFGGTRGQLYITSAARASHDRPGAGEEPKPIEEAPSVLAFFWSPDGSRLAFLQPAFGGENPSELLVTLTVLDLADGSAQSIAPLNLSPIFANEVVYRFDQFARSSTIWAPDGSALALGLIDSTGAPAVYVIPTPGEGSTPRRVASGDLPVWRPGAVHADSDRIALTETCSFGTDVCMFR